MPTPSSVVLALGRLVSLLAESPEVTPEHAGLAAELAALTAAEDLSIAADGFGLTVNGHQLTAGAPGAEALLEGMRRHRVGRIELDRDVPGTAVLALGRALASGPEAEPSAAGLACRAGFDDVGMVRLLPPPALPSASDTITLESLESARSDAGATEGAEPFPDLELGHGAPLPDRPAPEPLVERAPGGFQQLPLAEALARLEREPDGDDTGALLHHVTQLGRGLVALERWDDVLATGVALVRTEAMAGADLAPRYDAALRRLLTRSTLEALVPLVVTGPYRAEGFAVFQRGGADATDLLLERMVESEDVNERAAAFRGLQDMKEGTGAIVRLLDHDAWYVLRNVAELCGLMELSEAAPRLQALLGHADVRVRRAAAGALARLPGPTAGEGIRRALRDPDPLVRLEAAQALGGPNSRGFAMSIAVLLAEEEQQDVLRELHLALGRIGTPEAVQALGKAAEPGGVVRGRKPQAVRLAAIEGLRLAGGPVAERMLLALAADPDREVGAAASAAVDAMPG